MNSTDTATDAANGITYHHHTAAGQAILNRVRFTGDMHVRRGGASVMVYSRPDGEWHAATREQCRMAPPSRRTELVARGTDRDAVVDAVRAYLLAH